MTAASTQLSLCAHYANPEPDNAATRQDAWFSSLVNASAALQCQVSQVAKLKHFDYINCALKSAPLDG